MRTLVNKFWVAIEWDFQSIGVNALDYFLGVPGRNWDQFIRFYMTFTQVRGSYIQASQLEDPDVIEAMVNMPASEWDKPHKPALFGWTDVIDKLTDIGDQLIAMRSAGADRKKIKWFPRPEVPAVKARKERRMRMQDNLIEKARMKFKERRGL